MRRSSCEWPRPTRSSSSPGTTRGPRCSARSSEDGSPHVTHRGIEQLTAFADRFVDEGLHFEIEDILVAGPPWNTRVAVRAHDYGIDADTGRDRYNNRFVAFLEIRWGRLVRWEDYEDTERVAAWDAARV